MGSVGSSQYMGCWQPLLGFKNLGATYYDYVQRRGKVILISTRMVMVFGCWVTIWNPFFFLSFLTSLQRGRFV
jgi:hypothetical protein